APVTLIGADPERAYPAATALSNRALAEEGGFAYRAIPGTSHLLQLEEPALCAAAARAVLAAGRLCREGTRAALRGQREMDDRVGDVLEHRIQRAGRRGREEPAV